MNPGYPPLALPPPPDSGIAWGSGGAVGGRLTAPVSVGNPVITSGTLVSTPLLPTSATIRTTSAMFSGSHAMNVAHREGADLGALAGRSRRLEDPLRVRRGQHGVGRITGPRRPRGRRRRCHPAADPAVGRASCTGVREVELLGDREEVPAGASIVERDRRRVTGEPDDLGRVTQRLGGGRKAGASTESASCSNWRARRSPSPSPGVRCPRHRSPGRPALRWPATSPSYAT